MIYSRLIVTTSLSVFIMETLMTFFQGQGHSNPPVSMALWPLEVPVIIGPPRQWIRLLAWVSC